jgi:hypothetical protein
MTKYNAGKAFDSMLKVIGIEPESDPSPFCQTLRQAAQSQSPESIEDTDKVQVSLSPKQELKEQVTIILSYDIAYIDISDEVSKTISDYENGLISAIIDHTGQCIASDGSAYLKSITGGSVELHSECVTLALQTLIDLDKYEDLIEIINKGVSKGIEIDIPINMVEIRRTEVVRTVLAQ